MVERSFSKVTNFSHDAKGLPHPDKSERTNAVPWIELQIARHGLKTYEHLLAVRCLMAS